MKFTRLIALSVVCLLTIIAATPAHAMSIGFHGTTLADLSTPEPASLSLLVVGGVALLLRRHK